MPFSNKSVLIVDDDEKTNKMLKFMFQSVGVKAHSAFNGKEALDVIKTSKPDVIILDLMMPVMDGFEFCEKFKGMEEHNDIPIIVLSAIPEKQHKDQLKDIGVNHCFEKPFSPDDILSRVMEVI